MHDATIRTLSAATDDFCVIHAALTDLAKRLDLCRRDVSRCKVAASQLRKLGGMLAHVLDGLDAEILAAGEQAQRLAPAPF